MTCPREKSLHLMASFVLLLHTNEETIDPRLNERGINANGMSVISVFLLLTGTC